MTARVHRAAGLRADRRRLLRTFVDLVATPVLVVAGFVLLTVVSLLGDQVQGIGVLDSLRGAVARIIGPNAATSTLQSVAAGMATITSITFSVLLLAVQQTASTLSPVVFDQFIRRKGNQAFFGFFVGLTMFAYVTSAAVTKSTAPLIGAALGTVLSVVALLFLLRLVYSTIAQMRPASVIHIIHDRTLAARAREADLVRRTLRRTASPHPVRAECTVAVSGYVTDVRLDLLAAVLREESDAEVSLAVTLGDHLSYGEQLATVRSPDVAGARRIAAAVDAAVRVRPERDVAKDPTTGVSELGNIAWTSGSTSKQNPEVARTAVLALRDLALRWLLDDPVGDDRHREAPLPVVYRDNDLDRVLDVLYSMLVVSNESHQHMLAADVLDTYRSLLLHADARRATRLLSDVDAAQTLLAKDPPSPVLSRACRALAEARAAHGPLRPAR